MIGLSGGPDSVFLVYFFKSIQEKYNLQLVAAHLDHGWRTESTRDAQFCKHLCEQLSIPYHQGHLRDIPQKKPPSGSAEQEARTARRTFFQELARHSRADAIALAHHQEDYIETFFIRLIRGSGLTGLTSIKARAGQYIHPLLETSKQAILNYLHGHGIAYRTDQTNKDTHFLRNAIRHTLIPAYTQLDPRASRNVVRTLKQLHHADACIEKLAQEQYHKLMQDGCIDTQLLLALDSVLQHRILMRWIVDAGVPFTPTERFFAEIIRFLGQPESKTHWINRSWGIKKVKHKARITHPLLT